MTLHTQRKKGQHGEKLDSAAVLRSCLEGGVLVVGHSWKIITCTPGAARLLQIRPRQAVREGLPLLPPALQKIIRDAAGKRAAVARNLALPSVGDEPAALQVRAVSVPAGTGRRNVVVVLHNVSPSRLVEASLQRLDRLAGLGTLSAGMAHEIKNALVSVKTFVDLLLEKNRDAELTEVVRREIHRIDAIVGQMLKYAGPARPAFSAVRVHDVLDHSLRMVQPQIEGRLISLHRAFKASPDAIKGDDYQLEQAFVNLLLNAIEAMGPNGSLTVATDVVATGKPRPKAANPTDTLVRVAIADTGVGISPEHMERLFDPFFTTKQQGTGLGLTIARRIVQEHRGDISVQSQVNQGTTFSILLPAHGSGG